MRRDLLPVLLCPSCEEGNLSLQVGYEDGREVREGTLICDECSREYGLKGGMVDLLIQPSLQVEREKIAWASMRPPQAVGEEEREHSREWLLALPMLEGKEGQQQELETWRRHGSAVFSLLEGEEWRGRRVLELGAGRCWLSAHLSRFGAHVVAVDILDDDDIGLGCAQAFLDGDAFFERVVCDMHHLPFKDGSFDAVVATATLHHSPQPQVLLEEIRRVLAKGGMLVAANEPLYVPWRETPEEEKKGAHEGAYPLWGWLRYLRGSGLRLKELRVGRDASLHFTASTTAAGGVSASALAWNAASYIAVLALALPRFILRKARRIKAGWPMTKAPQGRIAYAKARLGLGGIAERALAEEDDNWGPGWYPCEEGDEPFRWCRPRARFLLPPPSGKETLVLELATFHPSPQSDPTEVEVRVGVKKAGEIFIRRHGWERLALRLTSVEGRRPTQISLRTRKGYFKPSAMGLGGDDRLLGVACRGAWWE